MSTLLEKPIKITRIVTTSMGHAKGIDDPTRAKVLEILYQQQLPADQILSELKKSGYKKALTTVRHHLEILKESGLIEIVKIEERRGAVTKFYGTSIKFLDYETPKDFDAKYSSVIKSTSGKIKKLLKNISQKTATKTKNSKSENPENYNQYIVMEIVNRAMTNILEHSK